MASLYLPVRLFYRLLLLAHVINLIHWEVFALAADASVMGARELVHLIISVDAVLLHDGY